MEKECTGGFCNGERSELPLNGVKKKWNTSINNHRTRDQISADGNVCILLSGRKWRFGDMSIGALNISDPSPDVRQSFV